MSSNPDLFAAAMSLPSQECAALAHQLLLSLDPPLSDDAAQAIDDAWLEEVLRREQAIRDGEPLRNWDDALNGIRDSLKQPNRQ